MAEVTRLVRALSRKFGDGADPYRALASVAEELGEVAAEINKNQGGGAKAVQGKKPVAGQLQEEVGDLLLSVFYLASALDVDLEAEMRAKIERLNKRFDLDI